MFGRQPFDSFLGRPRKAKKEKEKEREMTYGVCCALIMPCVHCAIVSRAAPCAPRVTKEMTAADQSQLLALPTLRKSEQACG